MRTRGASVSDPVSVESFYGASLDNSECATLVTLQVTLQVLSAVIFQHRIFSAIFSAVRSDSRVREGDPFPLWRGAHDPRGISSMRTRGASVSDPVSVESFYGASLDNSECATLVTLHFFENKCCVREGDFSN